MLDTDIRTAILKLAAEGRGSRFIAKALGIARRSVVSVLRSGQAEPVSKPRVERATPHEERILEQYTRCEGNLVRVQEELATGGISLAYSTLTSFCRRNGIGVVPEQPVGRYDFAPGEEMQHDTSPHTVKIGGAPRRLECASLVLCYARMIFAQLYPRWNRFWCKVFLSEAARYLEGCAGRCMLDNSHVVLAGGSGKNAIIAPEMVAFARRYGFVFAAHEKGHAERSGRVERPFHYIEHNFYPGRTFEDVPDANVQLRAWCDKVNGSFKRSLRAVPAALYARERTVLRPLPRHLPEVEEIHRRTVDSEGFVTLHTNRYSVQTEAGTIGHEVWVHEGATRVRIFLGRTLIGEHPRAEDGLDRRLTDPAHRAGRPRKPAPGAQPMSDQERVLRASSPTVAGWMDAARAHGGFTARGIRQLYRLWCDYPREPLANALAVAQSHGLFELGRIETMVLRSLGTDYFRLDLAADDDDDDDDDDRR